MQMLVRQMTLHTFHSQRLDSVDLQEIGLVLVDRIVAEVEVIGLVVILIQQRKIVIGE